MRTNTAVKGLPRTDYAVHWSPATGRRDLPPRAPPVASTSGTVRHALHTLRGARNGERIRGLEFLPVGDLVFYRTQDVGVSLGGKNLIGDHYHG